MSFPEPENPLPGDSRPVGDAPLRARGRRVDVHKLFDALETKAPEQPKLLTNSAGMKLVLIPAGSFLMGSPEEEPNHRLNESPRHEIILTRPFYLAVQAVTQQIYEKVMLQNPSRFNRDGGGSLEHPVENVSWEDAIGFCQRLTDLPGEKQAGLAYRLPTEAEWEFACRAGTTTPYAFGQALSFQQANFTGKFEDGSQGTALQKTARVGNYPSNNFGLFDMHGNVWEWCSDWYQGSYYTHSPTRDPQGPPSGQSRVVRGGSWRNQGATCRSAYRNALQPNNCDPYTGFRVAAVQVRDA